MQRCLLYLSFYPVHLPPIMPSDTLYRLPQSVRPAMLVIRMRGLVLVEDDHRSLLRILWIMQIPVMAGIPGHDRHIIGIRGYDGEILWIQALQIFVTEHRQPPSGTTLPAPFPQYLRLCHLPVRKILLVHCCRQLNIDHLFFFCLAAESAISRILFCVIFPDLRPDRRRILRIQLHLIL